MMEIANLEDLGVDGWIISTWILISVIERNKKISLRTGTGVGGF
jgi:hypothetical protein